MGRSSSKLLETPNNPLQELQYLERKRAEQKRQLAKEQKQIAKLQRKHAKKLKRKLANAKGGDQSQFSPALAQRRVVAAAGAAAAAKRHSSLSSCQTLRSDACQRGESSRQIEAKMQAQLSGDLCTFALNQMALAQQFFGNFESEITGISTELLERENVHNQQLEEHSILLTSPLDSAVAKWINYRPLHGPEKHNAQWLQRPAIYVVFENIDIARPNDANYDSISPLCRVDMETEFHQTTPCRDDHMDMLRAIKWKGYVRLKLRESPKLLPTAAGGLADDIYMDSSSSGYSTGTPSSSLYGAKAPSRCHGGESDYDYAFIAHLNTQHPLAELTMSQEREKALLDAKVLPESCVSSLGYFVDMWQEAAEDESDDGDENSDEAGYEEDDDDDEDDDEDDAEAAEAVGKDDDEPDRSDGYEKVQVGLQQQFRDASEAPAGRDYETLQALRLYRLEQERRRVLLQQRYLNSKEFMRYFGELMRQKLAGQLHIPPAELAAGSYRGSSIYTRDYEIIPAIHVAQNAHHWPDCAFQFRIRDRSVTVNSQTGQKFQWPTRTMIQRIESFGFHVVPMGFAPKRARNPYRELEWRIVFPKAERYLERHVTRAQARVFMMTKALVKTFVEPREHSKALMFALDHLRMHLFWECERNYTAWPEEFLGELLLRFIGAFMQRLREKCLPDFFVEERNLFESIPEFSLVTLYSILADILANPLMHLMVAFRYLHCPEQFFPKLNIRRLFDNFVENDMLKLRALAKNSRNLLAAELDGDEPPRMLDEGATGLVGMKQHREKTQGKLRRKTHLMRHHIEVKKKQEYALRRRSVESIDVELFFGNNLGGNSAVRGLNQGVENLRRTNILELLLDQFLAVCERGLAWRTLNAARLYLAQAERLCKLYHSYGCEMGAQEYRNTIQCLEERLEALQSCGDDGSVPHLPPTLPLRPSSVESVRPRLAKEWLERKETLKRQMEPLRHGDNDDDEEAEEEEAAKLHDIEQVLAECEQRLASVRQTSEKGLLHGGSVERKKSIKFEEHVVEVHAGDSNPIQKPLDCSPVGILRATLAAGHHGAATEPPPPPSEGETAQQREEKEKALEGAISQPLALAGGTAVSVSVKLAAKLNTAADLIKNAPLAKAKALQQLTTSTEKLISNVSTEEWRAQLRETLQRKTLQLKGAFNQSTAS